MIPTKLPGFASGTLRKSSSTGVTRCRSGGTEIGRVGEVEGGWGKVAAVVRPERRGGTVEVLFETVLFAAGFGPGDVR